MNVTTPHWPRAYHPAFILVSAVLLFVTLCGCGPTVPNGRTASRAGSAAQDSASSPAIKDQKTADLVRNGFVYLASGNPSLAKMLFRQAAEKSPDEPQVYLGLGRAVYQEGDFAMAHAYYDKAATLDPTNIGALVGKARAQRQQNKLNAAIEDINRAMAVEPNNIEVLAELATIYELMGKEALAAPIYQEILARTPDEAASNNNMGLVFLVDKQYEQAIIAFERALSLDGKDSRIKNNLATAFALYGEEQTALSYFKETVGEAGAYNNLGYLYMTQGRLDEAERALHQAMALNPTFYQRAQENLDRVKQLRRTAQ